MNFLNIFHVGIYLPLFNSLMYLQKVLPGHDLGLAIILLTLAIKIVLYYPSLSAIRGSRQLQNLQPKLKALQQKYKNDRETLAKEQMKLYKESHVNPAASCLPLLIQLVVFYQLYRVFMGGIKIDEQGLLHPDKLKELWGSLRDYFAVNPINTKFFNLIDLSQAKHAGNIVLAAIAGLAQFWQTKMLAAPKEPKIPGAKDESILSTTNKQMTYMMPLVTAWIAYALPAGLGVYWATQSLLTIAQQYIFIRAHPMTPSAAAANPPALPPPSTPPA